MRSADTRGRIHHAGAGDSQDSGPRRPALQAAGSSRPRDAEKENSYLRGRTRQRQSDARFSSWNTPLKQIDHTILFASWDASRKGGWCIQLREEGVTHLWVSQATFLSLPPAFFPSMIPSIDGNTRSVAKETYCILYTVYNPGKGEGK